MSVLTASLLMALFGSAFTASEAPIPSDSFARAIEPPEFDFPADHGSHPEFSTEWWYLTGSLEDEQGNRFGFQLTFFRKALSPLVPDRASGLAAREVILFHGGWTDVSQGRFYSDEAISRAASNWAGSERGQLRVFLHDRALEDRGDGVWLARFDVDEIQVELELSPTRAPMLHGKTPGLSVKGGEEGQASYYYSQTRLEARGRFRIEESSPWRSVSGRSWFDHEVFSDQLPDGYVGWDWFSVALSDGSDFMVFQIRDPSGETARSSSGTLRDAEGDRVHLERDDFRIEVNATWRSPAALPGEGDYPAAWRIEVPEQKLVLRVVSVLPDQEHRGEGAGGMSYWEGLCRFEGTRGGEKVTGLGYVELVGYRGRGPGAL